MTRVGIYVRVSTPKQSNSLQLKALKAYCVSRGWTALIIYEEKRTGTNDKRSELQRLMKDARSRKLDVVLCYKLDRFFRSLKNMVVTLEEFSELRVNFVCLKDQIDMTTSTGRLMTHIIAAFAEFESAIIKERVTAGVHAAMKKKGGRPWGPPRKFDKDNVHALKKKGNSIDEIAEKLKISRSSVFKTLAG